MKLQRHVRDKIRGSWVFPVHLDYFKLADMYITHVFMCLNLKITLIITFD